VPWTDERPGPAGHGLAGPDQARPPAGRPDNPRPWSREDLLQRLERLPRGHPSSPYNADGTRKPPLPDLRKLQLPPFSEASASPGADEPPPVT
jgi:hypothetical protein